MKMPSMEAGASGLSTLSVVAHVVGVLLNEQDSATLLRPKVQEEGVPDQTWRELCVAKEDAHQMVLFLF